MFIIKLPKLHSIRVTAPTEKFGKTFTRKGKKLRQLRRIKKCWKSRLKAKYTIIFAESEIYHSADAEKLLTSLIEESRND